MNALRLTRRRIIGHRRRATGLDERAPFGDDALRAASYAGIQDSMPRAAVLSLHARVADIAPDILDHPMLEQVWGPRFNAFVVAAGDRAPFTLGRLPRRGPQRDRAVETAARLGAFLDGRTMSYADAGREMGLNPNALRYASTTGTVLIHWEGSGRPSIRCVDAPDVDEEDARLDLARRFLHTFGPATVDDFSQWAGIRPPEARTTFETLAAETVAVTTPVGEALVRADDERSFGTVTDAERVRLLPSGDAFYLLWGDQRSLLVGDASRRDELWTSRVWPGALLIDGEICGTWSRRGTKVTVDPWRTLSDAQRDEVDAEIASMPLG